jgi:hypothetical protein
MKRAHPIGGILPAILVRLTVLIAFRAAES